MTPAPRDPFDAAAGPTPADRNQWLAERRRGIGSSDAAAVLDLDPWMSRWALYLDKRGEIPDREPNEAMEIGTAIEGFIADLYSTRHGVALTVPDGIYRHDEHEWMLANPDRFACDPADGWGVVEIKNASAYKASDWRDGAPAHYIVQVQHQLAVLGFGWGMLVALVGGNELVVRDVPRDDELIGFIIDAEAEFWQRIVEGNPPPIDGRETTEELLKRLYEEADTGTETVLDEAMAIEVARYWDAHDRMKAAEEEKREAGNRLRAALGTAELGFLPGGEKPLVTWKQGTRTALAQELVKADFPEVASKCTRTTTTRTLRPRRM